LLKSCNLITNQHFINNFTNFLSIIKLLFSLKKLCFILLKLLLFTCTFYFIEETLFSCFYFWLLYL
jgi:hypothetical protein